MARQTSRAAERTAPGITTQPLPHDDEAERLVLGTVMGTAGTLADVRQMLDAEAFYTPSTGTSGRPSRPSPTRAEAPTP